LKPWWREAIDFINVIGNRLIAESGDSKSKKFLFERISLVIQHGNAASIRGTFPEKRIFLTDGKIVANIVDKLKKRYIFLLIC
jgi:predicted N-acyltransferase